MSTPKCTALCAMLGLDSFSGEKCGVGEVSLSCLISAVAVERWWSMTTRGGKGVYNTNPAVMVRGGRSNAALSQQDCRTDADALRFCSRLIQSAESRSCITT